MSCVISLIEHSLNCTFSSQVNKETGSGNLLPTVCIIHAGFLLIFLTAGNLIAIGGYTMPGVWGQRPGGVRGAAPLAGSRGRAPCGVQGQRPWKLYVFHKVIRWNLHNLWCINDHLKGEVQSRITIISKERVKISLQIGAKMMKIG